MAKEIKCRICDKKFNVSPSHEATRKYCSRECQSKDQTGKVVSCPICGKERYLALYRLKEGAKYCSSKCVGIANGRRNKGKKRPNMKKSPNNNRLRLGIHCRWCGKLIKIQLSEYLSGRRYCSFQCQAAGRRIYPDVKCKNCGKTFKPNVDHKVFCNRECWREYQGKQRKKILIKCHYCGKIKEYTSRQANSHGVGTRKYCSKACADLDKTGVRGSDHFNWRGGKTSLQDLIRKSSYSQNYRQEVFRRDNWKSVLSGKNGRLVHHHIIPFSTLINKYNITKDDWLNFKHRLFDLDNAVTLAHLEHKRFHSKYGKVTTPEQFNEFKQNYQSAN